MALVRTNKQTKGTTDQWTLENASIMMSDFLNLEHTTCMPGNSAHHYGQFCKSQLDFLWLCPNACFSTWTGLSQFSPSLTFSPGFGGAALSSEAAFCLFQSTFSAISFPSFSLRRLDPYPWSCDKKKQRIRLLSQIPKQTVSSLSVATLLQCKPTWHLPLTSSASFSAFSLCMASVLALLSDSRLMLLMLEPDLLCSSCGSPLGLRSFISTCRLSNLCWRRA